MSSIRLLRIAVRNLGRNRRRTILTSLAVSCGVAVIIFLEGWVNGFCSNIVDSAVQSRLGAIQVFRKGYLGAEDPLKLSLPDTSEFSARMLAVSGVAAVAPRINFDGMISNGAESAMFIATAIEPRREYQVCPKRAEKVASGSQPLTAERDEPAAGRALLGRTLAVALGATAGTTLIMQASGPRAATNALDVVVSGFLPVGSFAESKRLAVVPLRFTQRLLRMEGQVTEYAIRVPDLEQVDEVAARLRTALADADCEVATWHELDPTTEMRATTIRYLLRLVSGVLFLLVAAGIVNAMLMSVYERVREIGTMLSLGMQRRQVAALFLYEAGAMCLFSGFCGTALGYAAVRALSWHGPRIRLPGGEFVILHPHVNLSFLGIVVLSAFAGALLSALYPAWQAARLHPAVALRSP